MEKRLCILCDEVKTEDNFTPTGYSGKDSYLRDHVCDKCKKIRKIDNYIDFYKKEEKKLTGRFDYKYMDEAKYNALFNIQEGKCKICGIHQSKLKKRLCVDHNHTTNEVRGLLCNKCNTGIGMMNENINNLKNAIFYLKESLEQIDPKLLSAIRAEILKYNNENYIN